jgi:hypothetical protein
MAEILTTASSIMCPHGGSVSIVSSNTSTRAGGAAMVRPSDTFIVAGCAFSLPAGPHPCVTVEWQAPAATTKAAGAAVLTRNSIGLCKAADQAVQGAAIVQNTQTRAAAL